MTQEQVKSIFSYNEESGILKRKVYNNRDIKAKTAQGYLITRIDCKAYLVHKIIYLYAHGVMPKTIDHINQDKTDNRLCNLREVSISDNNKNKPRYKNNTSGVMGVYYMKSRSKWIARIKVQNKNIHLGLFTTKEEAIQARLHAEKIYLFHQNHGT